MRVSLIPAFAVAGLFLVDPASAQTTPCNECAKLDTIDISIQTQTTEVKSVRRQLEKLNSQVDKLIAAPAIKSAVVIEFGQGIAAPFHTAFVDNQLKSADTIATEYCASIAYSAGKALDMTQTPASGFVAARRNVPKLVCFMAAPS